MKNIRGLQIIAALLLCWACQREVEVPPQSWTGTATTLEMGYAVPEPQTAGTRSLVDPAGTKDFPPLWVVVFDGTGYLVEYAKAGNFERRAEEVRFKVTLRTTSNKRIVHFLLGYTEDLHLKFGHESNVIGGLAVAPGQGVYWQRRVMRHGIDSLLVAQELRQVPLLRNFAKIKVVNRDVQDFSLTGFYVLNVPERGTVAPYSSGRFVEFWTGHGQQAKDYLTLVEEEDYVGTLPAGVQYLHRPGGEDSQLEWQPDGASYLLYEHTHTDDPATTLSVMLKGRYRGGEERYYKVDLIHQEADHAVYYHILRNFEYLVCLNEVVGEGEPDFHAACFGLSGNNLSSSIVVRKVLNVSDGKASLRVAYTDTTLVSAAPVQLRYRYVPDISRPDRTRNERVRATLLEGPDGRLFDAEIPYAETADGWATFTFTPLALPPYSQTQTVLIYSEENHLSRQVKFELRPPLHFGVTCSPKEIQEQRGEPVFVELFLPDQLGEQLFPLTFLIEAQERDNTAFLSNTLSPHTDEVMTVVSGTSIVPGFENKRSIQYAKTLEYADYLRLPMAEDGIRHRLTCRFVTNTERSAARVYVYNKFFEKTSDTMGY